MKHKLDLLEKILKKEKKFFFVSMREKCNKMNNATENKIY